MKWCPRSSHKWYWSLVECLKKLLLLESKPISHVQNQWPESKIMPGFGKLYVCFHGVKRCYKQTESQWSDERVRSNTLGKLSFHDHCGQTCSVGYSFRFRFTFRSQHQEHSCSSERTWRIEWEVMHSAFQRDALDIVIGQASEVCFSEFADSCWIFFSWFNTSDLQIFYSSH